MELGIRLAFRCHPPRPHGMTLRPREASRKHSNSHAALVSDSSCAILLAEQTCLTDCSTVPVALLPRGSNQAEICQLYQRGVEAEDQHLGSIDSAVQHPACFYSGTAITPRMSQAQCFKRRKLSMSCGKERSWRLGRDGANSSSRTPQSILLHRPSSLQRQ